MKAWVLWWRYHDGSGHGIERAYTDHKRAADDYALMKDVDGRLFELVEVPFYASEKT